MVAAAAAFAPGWRGRAPGRVAAIRDRV